jgi:hypothetical protein
MLSWPPVDDDIGNAFACRYEGDVRRRINRQSRAKRQNEISVSRGGVRALEMHCPEVLAKTDRRRFQETSAMAHRRLPGFLEILKVQLGVRQLTAILAFYR